MYLKCLYQQYQSLKLLPNYYYRLRLCNLSIKFMFIFFSSKGGPIAWTSALLCEYSEDGLVFVVIVILERTK